MTGPKSSPMLEQALRQFQVALLMHVTSTDDATDWRNDPTGAARDVLAVLNSAWPHQHQPGSFVTSLVRTLTHADKTNQALIGSVFPAHAVAVALYKDFEGGLAELDRLADWPELPEEVGIPRHAFRDGPSGLACVQMVDRNGSGEDCGLPARSRVHTR